MPNYTIAPAEVKERIARVMEKYHGDLHTQGVTIDSLYAYPTYGEDGEAKGVAISGGGYPAIAQVRKLSLKDRVAGRADAEITIDAEQYEDFTEEERDAVIDHELQHLVLVEDKKQGGFKRDDAGRPKLNIRLHDHQFGWFDAIVRRHGGHAIEAQQLQRFVDDAGQLWIPFLDDEHPLKRIAASDQVTAQPAKPAKSKKAKPGLPEDVKTMDITIGRTGKTVKLTSEKFVDRINKEMARQR